MLVGIRCVMCCGIFSHCLFCNDFALSVYTKTMAELHKDQPLFARKEVTKDFFQSLEREDVSGFDELEDDFVALAMLEKPVEKKISQSQSPHENKNKNNAKNSVTITVNDQKQKLPLHDESLDEVVCCVCVKRNVLFSECIVPQIAAAVCFVTNKLDTHTHIHTYTHTQTHTHTCSLSVLYVYMYDIAS